MRGLLLSAVMLLFAGQIGHAQTTGGLAESIEAELQRLTAAGSPFNGVILVADGDRELYRRASGFANFEFDVPVAFEHRFRIASLSKQFGGMLAVMLDEEGILDLHREIEAYVPELVGTPAGSVTLHHLLTHTSGLPNGRPYLWGHVISEYDWNWRTNRVEQSFSPDSFLVAIAKEEHATQPGASYQYCNECYVLAGIAIGRAAGVSYEVLLREKLLDPLGMNDTGLERMDSLIERRAYPYERADGRPFPISRFRNVHPLGPAGAMYSTLDDMQRWAAAVFYSDPFFTDDVRASFLPDEIGYRYGLSRRSFELNGDSVDVIWHTGQIAGTYAVVAFLPARNMHLIALSNIGFTFPQDAFIRAMLGAMMDARGGKSPTDPHR